MPPPIQKPEDSIIRLGFPKVTEMRIPATMVAAYTFSSVQREEFEATQASALRETAKLHADLKQAEKRQDEKTLVLDNPNFPGPAEEPLYQRTGLFGRKWVFRSDRTLFIQRLPVILVAGAASVGFLFSVTMYGPVEILGAFSRFVESFR